MTALASFRKSPFFYLDPPYWKMEGYDVDFPFEQYQRMAEILSNLKGKAILSINKHPDMCIKDYFSSTHKSASILSNR